MVQSSKLAVAWAACGHDGHWCDFLLVDLDSDTLSKGGVYVIWSENTDGSRKTAVYVGQGKPIADCLARHRDEVNITRHGSNGRVLRATWAKVGKHKRAAQNATSQIPSGRLKAIAGRTRLPWLSTFPGDRSDIAIASPSPSASRSRRRAHRSLREAEYDFRA